MYLFLCAFFCGQQNVVRLRSKIPLALLLVQVVVVLLLRTSVGDSALVSFCGENQWWFVPWGPDPPR